MKSKYAQIALYFAYETYEWITCAVHTETACVFCIALQTSTSQSMRWLPQRHVATIVLFASY